MEDKIKELIKKLKDEIDRNQSATRSRDDYLREQAKGFERGLSFALSLLENSL